MARRVSCAYLVALVVALAAQLCASQHVASSMRDVDAAAGVGSVGEFAIRLDKPGATRLGSNVLATLVASFTAPYPTSPQWSVFLCFNVAAAGGVDGGCYAADPPTAANPTLRLAVTWAGDVAPCGLVSVNATVVKGSVSSLSEGEVERVETLRSVSCLGSRPSVQAFVASLGQPQPAATFGHFMDLLVKDAMPRGATVVFRARWSQAIAAHLSSSLGGPVHAIGSNKADKTLHRSNVPSPGLANVVHHNGWSTLPRLLDMLAGITEKEPPRFVLTGLGGVTFSTETPITTMADTTELLLCRSEAGTIFVLDSSINVQRTFSSQVSCGVARTHLGVQTGDLRVQRCGPDLLWRCVCSVLAACLHGLTQYLDARSSGLSMNLCHGGTR